VTENNHSHVQIKRIDDYCNEMEAACVEAAPNRDRAPPKIYVSYMMPLKCVLLSLIFRCPSFELGPRPSPHPAQGAVPIVYAKRLSSTRIVHHLRWPLPPISVVSVPFVHRRFPGPSLLPVAYGSSCDPYHSQPGDSRVSSELSRNPAHHWGHLNWLAKFLDILPISDLGLGFESIGQQPIALSTEDTEADS
jgi:hypothetical protein